MERYQFVKKIGSGSYGDADLYYDLQDNRKPCVIKRIKVSSSDRRAALREGRLLHVLNHPNIIAYKEHFMKGPNLLCIVTEYASGGDLHQLIEKRKSTRAGLFTESEVLDLFVQICLAIKHVHDRKILHRDIKSKNVFLADGSIVKLGDFGIAKVLRHTLDCAKTALGTPYYLSPEICQEKRYNQKSDIWSLGCVLYEMVTFQNAFEGRNMKALLDKIINGRYTPISSKYSIALAKLISELLHKNPRMRPSINTILRKPIIQDRIKALLPDKILHNEFSHTILHGENVFRKNQNLDATTNPPPVPAKMLVDDAAANRRKAAQKFIHQRKQQKSSKISSHPTERDRQTGTTSKSFKPVTRNASQVKTKSVCNKNKIVSFVKQQQKLTDKPSVPNRSSNSGQSKVLNVRPSKSRIDEFNEKWNVQKQHLIRNSNLGHAEEIVAFSSKMEAMKISMMEHTVKPTQNKAFDTQSAANTKLNEKDAPTPPSSDADFEDITHKPRNLTTEINQKRKDLKLQRSQLTTSTSAVQVDNDVILVESLISPNHASQNKAHSVPDPIPEESPHIVSKEPLFNGTKPGFVAEDVGIIRSQLQSLKDELDESVSSDSSDWETEVHLSDAAMSTNLNDVERSIFETLEMPEFIDALRHLVSNRDLCFEREVSLDAKSKLLLGSIDSTNVSRIESMAFAFAACIRNHAKISTFK